MREAAVSMNAIYAEADRLEIKDWAPLVLVGALLTKNCLEEFETYEKRSQLLSPRRKKILTLMPSQSLFRLVHRRILTDASLEL